MNIVIFFKDGDVKKQRNISKIEEIYSDTDSIIITIEDGVSKKLLSLIRDTIAEIKIYLK